VFTHPVSDLAHWASKHSERVKAFASWGSNVVDCLGADGSNNVSVCVDVHDLAGLNSPEIVAAKQAHGVLEGPLRSTSRRVESKLGEYPTTLGSLTKRLNPTTPHVSSWPRRVRHGLVAEPFGGGDQRGAHRCVGGNEAVERDVEYWLGPRPSRDTERRRTKGRNASCR
jgi:hypothetical protein